MNYRNYIVPFLIAIFTINSSLYAEESSSNSLSPILTDIEQLINSDPAKARETIDQVKQTLADSVSENSLWLTSLDCQQYLAIGGYQQADDALKDSFEKFAEFKNTSRYGDLLICHGLARELLGDIKYARTMYQQAIELSEKIDSPLLKTVAYRSRGDLNAYHSTVESALSDLQMAYRIAEKNNDEPNILLAKNSLANLYSYIKDFQQSLIYYQDVYDYAKKNNNKVDLSVLSFNLARVYQGLDNTKKAENFFAESYQISEEIGDDAGIAYALKGLGQIAAEDNRLEVAESRLKEAMERFNKMGDKLQSAQCLILLGTVYHKQGNNLKSINVFKTAIKYFEEKESLLNLRNAYEKLAESYSANEDFQLAFEAHKKFHEYFEKHYEEDKDKRITDLRIAFDTERKEHDNQLLSEQNRFTSLELEKQTQLARFQFWILMLGGLLIVTLFFQIWRYVRNRRALEFLARTDELTNLSNRRHIMEFIEKEFIRSQRGSPELSLVMFDIDFFKQFNDKYGHKVGDRVLQNVAKSCVPLLRKSDILGRIGGEEFLLFLPNTKEDEAFTIAERCRKAISEIPTPLIGDEERVTISSGVVTYHEMMESVDDMLNKADMALYQAKKQGRNQTCIAE